MAVHRWLTTVRLAPETHPLGTPENARRSIGGNINFVSRAVGPMVTAMMVTIARISPETKRRTTERNALDGALYHQRPRMPRGTR